MSKNGCRTVGRNQLNQNRLDLSFTEMPTNRFVESAFWNFDAMFVPQQHPARELQDTFYVKGKSRSQCTTAAP